MEKVKEEETVLFVMSHMDDESYQAGTILKLKQEGFKIVLVTVCGLGRKNDKNNQERLKTYNENCEILFDKRISLNYHDLFINSDKKKKSIEKKIRKVITEYKVNWVFTHFNKDQHQDHRIVSDIVTLLCRPDRTDIDSFCYCYTPGSTERGENFNISEWTFICDITKYFQMKNEMLKKYGKELKGIGNSLNSFSIYNYFGELYNCSFAEIFKTVYTKN